jgi:isoleucyl-tRNA synthetase
MTLNLKEVEEEILKFWDNNQIYQKAKKAVSRKKKFKFIDGPPFVSGKIHLGQSMNKALKDLVLRYKRMKGFHPNDQPGYDCHGLPIEVQVDKKLGIKNKKEIESKIGVENFLKESKKFAIKYADIMKQDFRRLGVWMDWENPYMTLDNKYIEGVWWALKEAYKKKLLYKGEKVLQWCARCATALAKHELEYKTVKENSIFVKLPLKGKENEYLLVWTTTPWTIPLNMAVMVNPDLDYVKIKSDEETFIITKALAGAVMGVLDRKFEVLETFKGEELEGLEYTHPLEEEVPAHKKFKHKVVLSREYVTTEAGSGLVHCAPGCGPEDYIIGRKNKIPIFSPISENGIYEIDAGKYTGKFVRDAESEILQDLKNKGVLLRETEVEHEYPHCWRCKSGVIFRATEQWFLESSKFRKKAIHVNKDVKWVPEWGGDRFNNWLKELDDWCISRQRFWGIPLPIWICECGEIEVIGTIKELKKRSKKRPKEIDLHMPTVDQFIIKCKKCKKEMKRTPDVLDVWLDSGSAPWASLNYPSDKKGFKKNFPLDFITENSDQIRWWFNSLSIMSLITFNSKCYNVVYMGGMVRDEKGKQMHKSIGNVIHPDEIISKYGADTLRFYQISTSQPGLDPKIVWNEIKTVSNLLNVVWNTHKFIKQNMEIENYEHSGLGKLRVEDEWIISRINQTVKDVTEMFESYNLYAIPQIVLTFFVNDLSRTYLKLVKDRLYSENDKDKKTVLSVLDYTIKRVLALLAPVCPFISEQMYLNLKKYIGEDAESVHLLAWPKPERGKIDKKLNKNMAVARDLIQITMFAREKAGIGLRWPLKEVMVIAKKPVSNAMKQLMDIILAQTNIKIMTYSKTKPDFVDKKTILNFETLGPKYGKDFPILARKSMELSIENLQKKLKKEKEIKIESDGREFVLTKEDVIFEDSLPKEWVTSSGKDITVYLKTELTDDLFAEGFSREVVRRVQDLRKKLKLQKGDQVKITIIAGEDIEEMLKPFLEQVSTRTSSTIMFSTIDTKGDASQDVDIRGKKFKIAIKMEG